MTQAKKRQQTKDDFVAMFRSTGKLYHPNHDQAVVMHLKRDIKRQLGEDFSGDPDGINDEVGEEQDQNSERGPYRLRWRTE